MTTIQYYIHFLKNAFNFTGRASIEQFFSVIVANFAANLFLTVFGFLLRITGTNLDFIFKIFEVPLFIFWIYSLIAFLTLCIRRLHDSGKLFIWILVPFLNIYLLLQKGDEEKNKYGEVPV